MKRSEATWNVGLQVVDNQAAAAAIVHIWVRGTFFERELLGFGFEKTQIFKYFRYKNQASSYPYLK